MKMSERGKYLCPYCRAPQITSGDNEEENKRLEKLTESNHPHALFQLAGWYAGGEYGDRKANELWLKAGELGSHEAYFNLGNAYREGRGAEMDMKKAKHYYELAAMMGSVHARQNLAIMELNVDNHCRAFKHYIIAARAGHEYSLAGVKEGFMKGDVAKEEYADTLRAYQKAQDDMKSDMRDEFAKLLSEHPLH